jgi:cystinosin
MSGTEGALLATAISRAIGWLYVLCWYALPLLPEEVCLPCRPRSASFYPQPISNWQRKHTLGLAIDFPTLNLLGFSCYAISTAAFLYSPTIRSQYAYRHEDSPNTTVRFNDFLFAAHGAIMCMIIYSQFFPRIWGFKVGSRQKASRPVLLIFWASIVVILVVALLAQITGENRGYDPSGWAWIDVVSLERFEI